jgi:hypothetical protein
LISNTNVEMADESGGDNDGDSGGAVVEKRKRWKVGRTKHRAVAGVAIDAACEQLQMDCLVCKGLNKHTELSRSICGHVKHLICGVCIELGKAEDRLSCPACRRDIPGSDDEQNNLNYVIDKTAELRLGAKNIYEQRDFEFKRKTSIKVALAAAEQNARKAANAAGNASAAARAAAAAEAAAAAQAAADAAAARAAADAARTARINEILAELEGRPRAVYRAVAVQIWQREAIRLPPPPPFHPPQ